MEEDILQYITETIKDRYGYSDETAKRLIRESCFPELLKQIPDYVCHYSCEYWAKKIVEDRWK